MMDKTMYVEVIKQLLQEVPDGLDEESDESAEKFAERMNSVLELSWFFQTDDCVVEVFDSMPNIRKHLDDEQWAELTDILTADGKIEVYRISVLGQPILEAGRFYNAPLGNAGRFRNLPKAALKGITRGLVETIRDAGLNIVEAYTGRDTGGKIDVDDSFAGLLREVLDDEIEDAVADFRQSLMAEVTAAHFAPAWGPPTGGPVQPPGGGES